MYTNAVNLNIIIQLFIKHWTFINSHKSKRNKKPSDQSMPGVLLIFMAMYSIDIAIQKYKTALSLKCNQTKMHGAKIIKNRKVITKAPANINYIDYWSSIVNCK